MSQTSYPVPDLAPGQCHETSLLIRRSRFLTHIARASSPDEARAFVELMRVRHADATHNCWAFNAGPPGSTAQIGASDDGEPHGTAGRPMLGVLLHGDVGEICCVVTRWFGGIKLGTGGLVRAYQDCVAGCLDTLPRAMRVSLAKLAVEIGYADNERVRRLLARHGASVTSEEYGADILLEIGIPGPAVQDFTRELADLTSGSACVIELESD
ncbi:MAG: YigZ family protein [Desulfovibrionaceae bacterium]|nr:YigZ family protein [Desulfovibrionaceae bacterium]